VIAIFTHRRGTEADRVIRYLIEAGDVPVRVNMGHAEALVSLEIGRDGRIEQAQVECDQRRLAASDVRSAWMHQSPPAGPAHLRGTPHGVAAESSRMRLWEAFTEAIPGDAWLTAPRALSRVANKVFQYRSAGRCGLAVPPTVAGNAPRRIRRHATLPTVVKYLGDSAHLWALGRDGVAAVTAVADIEGIADDILAESPALYQRAISTVSEVRVVAVRAGMNADVFAAAGTKPAGLVDIRLAHEAMKAFEPTDLPRAVQNRLIATMSHMEVGFCSADLLLDAEGVYWFVDLNASGAWWWIDDLYERQVTTAIAERLRRGPMA
jgi:hypothetical protein